MNCFFRTSARFCFLLTLTLSIVHIFTPAFAEGLNNNEVEFTGVISSVVQNGEGGGTLFVKFDNLDLRVLVNSQTNLQGTAGEEIFFDDILADQSVQVTGKFSASGILASDLKLLNKSENDFSLRGHITAVQKSGDNLLVSLLGITLLVNSDTKIQQEGAKVPASELKPGMFIEASGKISGNTWTATDIKVLSEQRKKDQVKFEGIVRSYQPPSSMEVEVDGVPTAKIKVLLDSNTRITGQIVVGAMVLVKGTLNSDFSVNAREVRVLPALEIKPDERKVKVGDKVSFTVKLREHAASDVTVLLSSSDTAVLTVSPASVTIPKGEKTADFSATALKMGSAIITASALDQKATASVTVGQMSEEETDKPSGPATIAFAPPRIRMGLNETRDVVLLIKPPQKSSVKVEFTIISSVSNLVSIAGTNDFSNGAAALKVTIKSGSQEGTASVIAALPSSLGAGKAELVVTVSAKKDDDEDEEKAEIDFRPDGVKVDVGESRRVNLFSSQTFPADVSITITGNSTAAEITSPVTLPAGSKSVTVAVAGKAEGKTTFTAVLPPAQGGDSAKLEVEVRKKN
ncbi:MAG TPA: DUF5666 domain-containing protein [Acidobacteriota bacterium]|jgi:hypothetical protein